MSAEGLAIRTEFARLQDEVDRLRTGLFGVGLKGAAPTERLLGHQFEVAGSSTDEAETCERLGLNLPDSNVIGDVLNEVKDRLHTGKIFIDTTPRHPRATILSERRLGFFGVPHLEPALCGNSDELRWGEVLVVAGQVAGKKLSTRE